jgi:hypothetical protein
MTRSSTDAEIVAAEAGLFIGNYYRDVLDELGVETVVVQLQDNLSCIRLVETGMRAYDIRGAAHGQTHQLSERVYG